MRNYKSLVNNRMRSQVNTDTHTFLTPECNRYTPFRTGAFHFVPIVHMLIGVVRNLELCPQQPRKFSSLKQKQLYAILAS